jgi:nitrate/nitrite-specific signal transduction histidine kinase
LRRNDLEHRWPIFLFIGFILACGATHLFSIITLWAPVYGIEGLVKALTAALSVITAIALRPLLPIALKLPSRTELRTTNQRLATTVANLEQRVAERTRDLEDANRDLSAMAEKRGNLLSSARRSTRTRSSRR